MWQTCGHSCQTAVGTVSVTAWCDKVDEYGVNVKPAREVWIVLCDLLVVVLCGADKSFARPTSRCTRTESILSLERGVCSCAELYFFFVFERKHVRRRSRIRILERSNLSNSNLYISNSWIIRSFFMGPLTIIYLLRNFSNSNSLIIQLFLVVPSDSN